MSCSICTHECRAQIENAILNTPTTEMLEKVAKEYNVDIQELQVHVMMHSPIGVNAVEDTKESIARKSKIREMDLLLSAANEYMVTLKTVGEKITREANNSDFVSFSRSLTKSMVELYLGTGSELRNTVKVIMDTNEMLNGPKDGAVSGLTALANAIRGSKE